MAVVTLDEMRNNLRTLMDLDTTEMPNTTVDIFLKEGWRRVWMSQKRWPWLRASYSLSVTGGTQTYTYTTIGGAANVIGEITAVDNRQSNQTSRRLMYVGHDEAMLLWPATTNSGTPYHYSIENQTLWLWPTPAASETLTIRAYRKGPDWFSTGTNDPYTNGGGCPEELHNVIFLWGVARAYAQQEDTDLSAYYGDLASSEMETATRLLMSSPAPQPLIVGGGPRKKNFGRLRHDFE